MPRAYPCPAACTHPPAPPAGSLHRAALAVGSHRHRACWIKTDGTQRASAQPLGYPSSPSGDHDRRRKKEGADSSENSGCLSALPVSAHSDSGGGRRQSKARGGHPSARRQHSRAALRCERPGLAYSEHRALAKRIGAGELIGYLRRRQGGRVALALFRSWQRLQRVDPTAQVGAGALAPRTRARRRRRRPRSLARAVCALRSDDLLRRVPGDALDEVLVVGELAEHLAATPVRHVPDDGPIVDGARQQGRAVMRPVDVHDVVAVPTPAPERRGALSARRVPGGAAGRTGSRPVPHLKPGTRIQGASASASSRLPWGAGAGALGCQSSISPPSPLVTSHRPDGENLAQLTVLQCPTRVCRCSTPA